MYLFRVLLRYCMHFDVTESKHRIGAIQASSNRFLFCHISSSHCSHVVERFLLPAIDSFV